jgi:hypothetical protein
MATISLSEQAAHISSPVVIAAYGYLVGYSKALPNLVGLQNLKGQVQEYQYWIGDRQPYAFIVNKGSLLFYFRQPDTDLDDNQRARLMERFETAINSAGEFTVRLTNIEDASVLMREIFGR